MLTCCYTLYYIAIVYYLVSLLYYIPVKHSETLGSGRSDEAEHPDSSIYRDGRLWGRGVALQWLVRCRNCFVLIAYVIIGAGISYCVFDACFKIVGSF